MSEIDWEAMHAALVAPMPRKQFKGRGGRTFDYITARQVMDRLDQAVGPGGWSTAFRVIDPQAIVVECTLTIHGVSRADSGYPNNTGDDHEDEAFKSAYSDAFKRAAVHFGVGRFLYGDVPASPPPPAPRQSAPAAPQARPAPADGEVVTHPDDELYQAYSALFLRAAEEGMAMDEWRVPLPIARPKLKAQGAALKSALQAHRAQAVSA